MEIKFRTAEKLQHGVWEKIEFEKIRKGQTIRLFESDGKPVKDKNGNTKFYITESAKKLDDHGNYSIIACP